MKSPSTPPPPLSDGSRVSDAVRAQILATEHWSLLATRSMTWNEAFSRAAMFLTVLSAAVVALAFVAEATAFGPGFRLFALVVLPIVLLVGLGSLLRIASINTEDFWLVAGMNRLRHAYLELAPELEPYFVTGHQDNLHGISLTYSPSRRSVGISLILYSTPIIIGVINALVAGVLVALIAQTLGASATISAMAGAIAGLGLLLVLYETANIGYRSVLRDYRPRFPRG